MRPLSLPAVATASATAEMLRRIVGPTASGPHVATGASVASLPFDPASSLVSLPLLGTVSALVVTVLGALVTWFLYRNESATEAPSQPPSSPEPAPDEPGTTVDGRPLSPDEAFVVDLLRAHEGRLRQSAIVDASEWSKSKVSRLLSSMERKGYVEKVTIGRENAIVLSSRTQ